MKNLINNSAITRLQAIVCVVIITASIAVAVYGFNIGNIRFGPGPVEIEMTTDRPYYLQGEEVNFTITVNNPHNWPVLYPNVVNYQIKRNDQIVDEVTAMITLAGFPTFPAHSRTIYDTYVWDQKTGQGNNRTQVPIGNYMLNVSFGGQVDYGIGGNYTFEIRPNPSLRFVL